MEHTIICLQVMCYIHLAQIHVKDISLYPANTKHCLTCLKKRVMVSTAAFLATVRGPVPGLGGLKETKMFLPHPRVKVSIVGSLRDRGVAFSTSAARARISNAVSRGQCHLNHLTILRRFSWPSLAYMCTKVA